MGLGEKYDDDDDDDDDGDDEDEGEDDDDDDDDDKHVNSHSSNVQPQTLKLIKLGFGWHRAQPRMCSEKNIRIN